MSDYFASFSKIKAIERINEVEHGLLFARDVKVNKGNKEWIVSTLPNIYCKIHRSDGKLRSKPTAFYEVFDETSKIAFGVDGDFSTKEDGTFAKDFDMDPTIIDLISKINSFMKDNFELTLTLRDWLVTRTVYCETKKKHSFHLKLVGYRFASVIDVKHLAVALDMAENGVDYAIYRRQPFRLTGCSKLGQNRPALPYCIEHEGQKTLMPSDFPRHFTYWKSTTLLYVKNYKDLVIPASMRKTRIQRLKHKNQAIALLEMSDMMDEGEVPNLRVIKGMMDCLSDSRAQKYDTWFPVCFALLETRHTDHSALFDLWETFSRKWKPENGSYDADAVTRQWNSCKSTVLTDVSCSQGGKLFNMARKDNYEQYREVLDLLYMPAILSKEFNIPFEDFTKPRPTADEQLIRDMLDDIIQKILSQQPDMEAERPDLEFHYEKYHERWCRAIPEGYDIVILISGMGSGKSFATIKFVSKKGGKKIIKVSPRIKYSEEAKVRFAENGLDMDIYYDLKDVNKAKNLIISPESLFKRTENRDFSVFDGDEIESILRQFSSEETMIDLPGSFTALVDIMQKANHVVLSDAHISMRTIEFLKAVFKKSGKKALIMHNTHPAAQERKAVEYRMTNKSPHKLIRYQNMFIDRIIESLKEGKNIGVHATSKKFSDRLVHAIVENKVLTLDQFAYYHGKKETGCDDIPKYGKAIDLTSPLAIESANTAWHGKRMVVWTPAITCGMSYDRDAKQKKFDFDLQYAYITAKSVNACIAAQAIQRIRNLNDNTLHFMVDEVPSNSHGVSTKQMALSSLRDNCQGKLEAFDKFVNDRYSIKFTAFRDLMTRFKNRPDLLYREMETMYALTCKTPIVDSPASIRDVLAFNMLENDLHAAHIRGFFYYCLEKEGICDITVEEFVLPDQVDPTSSLPATGLSYDSLPLIDDALYANYWKAKMSRRDTTFSNAALEKYLFVNCIVGDSILVTEKDRAFLFDDYQNDQNHKDLLFKVYSTCKNDAFEVFMKDLTVRPYLETTRVNGPISMYLKEICSVLGLATVYDTVTVIDHSRVKNNLKKLAVTLDKCMVLLRRPQLNISCTDYNDGKAFRKVLDKIKLLFRQWLGLDFQNLIERKTGRNSNGQYSLVYCDKFSEVLYTCGIFD